MICLKFTTFVVATTVNSNTIYKGVSCDLLKIYYLCGSNNSCPFVLPAATQVVICLKFTTFVVATTVLRVMILPSSGCDLLKIYYLCGSNNSQIQLLKVVMLVVICLKFTTFVVATTVCLTMRYANYRCDLLKIYYLCGSNNSS